MHPPLPPDKRAGYLGLIAGLVSIIITVILIVELTNRKFDSHEAAPHSPPPAGQSAPAPAPH
jgi:hypothetical protein